MTFFKPIRCRWKYLFNFTESFSVTPPLRIRYVSMLLVSIHCLFRHTGILSLGKEKMVQWTTPFMIGITNDGLNSDIVGQCFLSATNRLTYIIPQSTQKIQESRRWVRGHLLLRLAFLTDHVQPFLQLKVRYSNQPNKLTTYISMSPSKSLLWLNQQQVVFCGAYGSRTRVSVMNNNTSVSHVQICKLISTGRMVFGPYNIHHLVL